MLKKISIWTVIIWIIGWGIAYLIILPPINPSSLMFWAFFGPAVIIPLLVILQINSFKHGFRKGKALWPTLIGVLIAGIIF